uniref:Rab-GAP TBC domain-containing protein n=1 Tax=Jaculus jaculus TaxID=51337 RepID=A0A8C5K4J4_JACJA
MELAECAQAARARVPRPEDFDYAAYEEFFSLYLVIFTKRAIKWAKLLKGGGGIRRSVTVGLRPRWTKSLDTTTNCFKGESSPSLEEAIRTDLNRTFPDNVRFRKTAEPCVGYCQGMNYIAGYLILITKSEEESFWLLDALVGRILPNYYSPAMLGLKTDQEVLAELVRMKLPAVAALMDDGHGVLWTLLVSGWFNCLFMDILPVETVLRIWDCLFNEGSKIIFRVALTLIKQHQAFILEASSVPDICDKFKQITKGDFVTECHTFMQNCKIFSEPGSLSMTTITRLPENSRAALLAQG